jgi:hypothetical protein
MLVPGKGKTAQARLWAYVVDNRACGGTAPALVWYKFSPDRSGIHPQTELKSLTGLFQADGYAGYEKLYIGSGIQEVACWAHLWMPPLLQGILLNFWQYPRLQSSIRPVVAKRLASPALMVNPQAGSQSGPTSSTLDAPNGSMPAPVRPVLPSCSERSSHPRRPYCGRTCRSPTPTGTPDCRMSRHNVVVPKRIAPHCLPPQPPRLWQGAYPVTAQAIASYALASA